ncbi:MAG TPA: hypothetical protein VK982_00740, partial [Bacteroidales bacterium]|nr:hypothetical protein [Bacteroidales bacterium]
SDDKCSEITIQTTFKEMVKFIIENKPCIKIYSRVFYGVFNSSFYNMSVGKMVRIIGNMDKDRSVEIKYYPMTNTIYIHADTIKYNI